ncbi:MAG: HEAT repeat domain-containing protein [Gemmatimonadaceae bacterium]
MKQWLAAAIVLAALVPRVDAQDPPPRPKPVPAPEVRVRPDVNIDVRELGEHAREMAERVRENIDVSELEWRAEELAARVLEFDFSEMQLHAEEMADRVRDHDFSEMRWQAEDMAERMRFDFESNFHFDFDAQGVQEQIQSELMDAQEHMRDAQHDLQDRQRELFGHEWRMGALEHIEPSVTVAMESAQHALQGIEWSGAADLADITLRGVAGRFENRAAGPRAAWAPGDPADSLYRLAREVLNRGNYRRAADLFRDISERYPSSQYSPDALYWEAFALYRIGTTAELERARTALGAQRARYADAYARSDGASLAQRIAGALAQRGDRSARAEVTSAAGQQGTCDKEDLAVRVEALNALSSLDFAAARPILERVLNRRDDCTVGLRKRAVFLIGKQPDASSAQLLATVVRNETSPEVRNDAILWLSRVPGDQTVAILDELLRASTDERVQQTALRALAAHESQRARAIVRSTVERQDAPEKLRESALSALLRGEPGAEDAAFLRGLYPRLQSERLKKSVVRHVGSMGGAENHAWLIAMARNGQEPMEMRSEALGRVGRSNDVSMRELVSLYDALAARELREQLISVYGRRKEPEATDKLIDIAKTGTDPRLRRLAISALTRKNDPRTTQLLLEIIES